VSDMKLIMESWRKYLEVGKHAGGLSLSDPEVGSLSLTGEVDPGSLSFT